MGFFSELFKSTFDKWLENATDAELSEGYEKRRQQWIKDGCSNGERTYEMKEIDREMGKRAEKEWKTILIRIQTPIFVGLMKIAGIK